MSRLLRLALENPLAGLLRQRLPVPLKQELDQIRAVLKEGKPVWTPAARHEGDLEGEWISGVRHCEGDLYRGAARMVNVFKGNVLGGSLRGCNVAVGDLEAGEISLINILVGNILGGFAQQVNIVIGDVRGEIFGESTRSSETSTPGRFIP
ncbi:MAG: hypothetical protein ACWGSD_02160 [Thermodesulfobacteriota bacterium]